MAKNFIEDIGFGAQGSTYANQGSNAIRPPEGQVYSMVQMVTDTVFTNLIAESDTTYINTSTSGGGVNGANLESVTFSRGMIIYGRWTSIDLTSGSVIAYISN